MHLLFALHTQQYRKQMLELKVRMVMETILARVLNSTQRRDTYEQSQDLPGE